MRATLLCTAVALSLGPALAACADEPITDDRASALTEHRRCQAIGGDRLSMLAADRIASALTGALGADGFLALAGRDLTFLAPGEPILRGRDAVRDYLERSDPGHVTRYRWGVSRVDVGASGDLGYTFGWSSVTTRAADGSETVTHGKYANVWRRSGAVWRLIAHSRTRAIVIDVTPAPDFPLFPDGGRRCVTAEDPGRALEGALDADRDFAALSLATSEEIGFRTYAAPQAAVLSPGLPLVIGPDAIGALYADDPPEDTLEWAPVGGAVAATGDLGYTTGLAVYVDREPGGDTRYPSKYVTLWQKQADGAWRYVADCGSSRPAP